MRLFSQTATTHYTAASAAAAPLVRPGKSDGETPRRSSLNQTYLMAAVLAILVAILYRSIAVKLVTDWYELPDFSHGFLIPFFVTYILWDKRKALANTPVQPSWVGLPLVLLGLFFLLVGVFGADLFFSRISFVVLSCGLVWMLSGLPMLRQVGFSLFVLVLAIPLPTLIFNKITFPLQLFASRLSSMALPLLGVPVLQDGNVIQLPTMQLEVAEACSGIRSLLSLFTLAVIYGYLLEKSPRKRVILALSSLPIAVAANVARIVGTGLCVQYWNPDKAVGFFHEFSGWLMFLVSLSLLYAVHQLLQLGSGRRQAVAR